MADVLMEHPELDGRVIKVAESAVPFHMASGWRLIEGEKAEAKAEEKLVADENASLASSSEGAAESGSKSGRRSASKE